MVMATRLAEALINEPSVRDAEVCHKVMRTSESKH